MKSLWERKGNQESNIREVSMVRQGTLLALPAFVFTSRRPRPVPIAASRGPLLGSPIIENGLPDSLV